MDEPFHKMSPAEKTAFRIARRRAAEDPSSEKSPAQKAVETKGKDERSRAAHMANWTRQNGKDDAKNPYSRENYY
jgi:hypothetical protein